MSGSSGESNEIYILRLVVILKISQSRGKWLSKQKEKAVLKSPGFNKLRTKLGFISHHSWREGRVNNNASLDPEHAGNECAEVGFWLTNVSSQSDGISKRLSMQGISTWAHEEHDVGVAQFAF